MENINSQDAAPKNNGGGVRKILVLVIILLLLSGGVAAAYWTGNVPAQPILQASMLRLSQAKTADYKGSAEFSGDFEIPAAFAMINPQMAGEVPNRPSHVSANLNYTAKVDMTNKDKPNTESSWDINFGMSQEGLEQKLNVQGDMKSLGDAFYFQLRQIPSIVPLKNPDAIKNQWYKLDDTPTDQSAKNNELTADEINQIKAAYQKNPFVSVARAMGSENIDGVATFRYALDLNRDKLLSFLDEVGQITSKRPMTDEEKKSFNDSMDMIKNFDGQIWIGKTDWYPRQFKLAFDLQQKDKPEKLHVVSTMTANSFNAPIKIEEPANPKPAYDLVKTVMEQYQNPVIPQIPQRLMVPNGGKELTPAEYDQLMKQVQEMQQQQSR